MWRRMGPWVKGGLLLVVLLLLAAAGVGALARVEPDFYKQAVAVGPQPDDPTTASEIQTRLIELSHYVAVPYSTDGDWSRTFTTDDLNAFLRESGSDNDTVLLRPNLGDNWSDLRVSVSGDRLQVGARLGEGLFSTVVSIELKAWLVAGEPNAVALEVLAVRAGALPWVNQEVRNLLSSRLGGKNKNAEVKWYRGNGNPVAVVRFRVNQPQPDMLLQTVSIADGKLTIGGKNFGGP
jgi:hypothetical protein